MNKKNMQWLVIAVLVLGVAGLSLAMFRQHTPVSSLEKDLPKDAGRVEDVKPVDNVDATSSSTQIQGREAFGPLVSPDGKRLLVEEHKEERDVDSGSGKYDRVNHRFLAKGLQGQGQKVLLTLTEERTPEFTPRGKARFTSSWQIAGWSADGRKVYYVSIPLFSDVGGYFPNGIVGYNQLYEVDVEKGGEKPLLSLPVSLLDGIKDVYANKQEMTFVVVEGTNQEKSSLFVSNLDGSNRKRLFTENDKEQGISYATIDPTGQKIAAVTYLSNGGAPYKYTLQVIDVQTLEKKAVKTPNSEWSLIGWSDKDTVRLQVPEDDGAGGYKTREIDVNVK